MSKPKFRIWHFLYLTAVFGAGLAVNPQTIFVTLFWLATFWLAVRFFGRAGKITTVLMAISLLVAVVESQGNGPLANGESELQIIQKPLPVFVYVSLLFGMVYLIRKNTQPINFDRTSSL